MHTALKKNNHQLSLKKVRTLLNDPEKIDEEIERTQRLSEENLLDKSLKDRIRELKMMKSVALKKKLVDIAVGRVKSDQQEDTHDSHSSGSTRDRHSGHTEHHADHRRIESSSAFVEQKPENSVYFHPVHNPTGAPPPGQPQLYIAKPQQPSNIPSNMNAVAIGGINGIPLPPPRPPPFPGSFGPHIPPAHLSMIPSVSYPYPAPFAIGGMQGIPPPPPLPSATMFPVHSMNSMGNPHAITSGPGQSLSSSHAESTSSNKRRREIKGGPADFDPLDPSAAGYVERFGRQKPQPNSELPQQPTAPAPGSWESTHAGMLMKPQVMANTASFHPPPPLLPLPLLPPVSISGSNITAVEFSNSNERPPAPTDQQPAMGGGFKILTAEELMRRRHLISTEEPQVPASAPTFPDADMDTDMDIGPSMPTEYLTASEIETKEVDDKPSGLSGLVAYDSDRDSEQDNDGDGDQDDGKEKDKEMTYPYSYAAIAYPQVVAESANFYPAPTTSDYYPSAAYAPVSSSVVSIAPASSSMPSAQVGVVGNRIISGPKIIKADKALTAFVPNVLKQKKQVSTVTTATKTRNIPVTMPSSSSALSKPAASIAVDDAYKQFFEELNVLGAI